MQGMRTTTVQATFAVLWLGAMVGTPSALAQDDAFRVQLAWPAGTDVHLVVTDPAGFPVSVASHRSEVTAESEAGRDVLRWARPTEGEYLVCAIGNAAGGATLTLTVTFGGREASRTYERSGVLGRPCTRGASGFLLGLRVGADSPLATAEPSPEPPPAVSPSLPAVSAPAALDEITLADGSFLRGTIIEHSAERVVVLLPTGETRTYPAAEVASVALARATTAPASSPTSVVRTEPPAVAAPAPAPARGARLHVWSDSDGLSLHQLTGTGTATVSTGNGLSTVSIDQFAVLCNIPCDTEIPAGTYVLGVAHGSGTAMRAGAPRSLIGDIDLHVTYDDRSGIRTAGWATLIAGGAVGVGLVLGSLFAGNRTCSSGRCHGSSTNIPMMIVGGVVFGLSMIVAFPMAFLNDAADIEVGVGF